MKTIKQYAKTSKIWHQQNEHLDKVLKYIAHVVHEKYTLGMLEHKACLGDMSEEDLLNNIEEEAIDLLVYVAALRIKQAESNS